MECRKHISQMSSTELQLLEEFTEGREYVYTPYSFSRIKDRKIKDEWVRETIKTGNIIEVHFKGYDIRILKRSKWNYNHQAICVVYSIVDDLIVTAYCNYYWDSHETLDESNYNSKLDIIKMIRNRMNVNVNI